MIVHNKTFIIGVAVSSLGEPLGILAAFLKTDVNGVLFLFAFLFDHALEERKEGACDRGTTNGSVKRRQRWGATLDRLRGLGSEVGVGTLSGVGKSSKVENWSWRREKWSLRRGCWFVC